MAPADPQAEQVFTALQALKTAWPMKGWSWDSRLYCIASSFGAHNSEDARAAIAKGLSQSWTKDTIGSAPERVQALATQCEGIRKGQLLLTGGDLDGLLPFGLWWPWEESPTISFRLGLAELDPSHRHYARLFNIFGVSP